MRIIVLAFFTILVITSLGSAIPRYSTDYNQSCALCHIDPSGGGARSLYGAQFFAYTELAQQETSFEEIGKIQPMLNEQIQIGIDARTQFFAIDEPSQNSFMEMQGDLYVAFMLSPQWTFYLDKGLYQGFEAWGMGHILPYNGYFKVGHFTPPFGLRMADHKVFVRSKMGMQYNWAETGMEIGFHPEKFTLAMAVTNGQGSPPVFDSDEGKAFTARADLRIPVSSALLWLGVTGRYNEISEESVTIAGGYGGLNISRFTLLGEVDYRDYAEVQALASFVQLGFRVNRGWTLKGEYDFFDGDIDYETGAESMYVFGAEYVPFGFLAFLPNIRYHDLDPGSDFDYYEGELQFHFFF